MTHVKAMNERPRVLVVEDNRPLAENIADILSEYGIEATLAASVDEALEHVDDGLRGVITDLRLPGRSGIELIVELRSRGIAVPVVVVTAFADHEAVRSAERAGALDVLPKPVDVPRLVELLEELTGPREDVLIVEDSAALADNLAEATRERGLRPVVATSVRAALDQRRLPSVAIVDLGLPDGDGLDAARVLCARDPELKVIVITGRTADELPAIDVPNVVSPVLEKPLDLDTLVKRVEEVVARCRER